MVGTSCQYLEAVLREVRSCTPVEDILGTSRCTDQLMHTKSVPEKCFTVDDKILSIPCAGEAQHIGPMLLLQNLSESLEVDSWLIAAQSL